MWFRCVNEKLFFFFFFLFAFAFAFLDFFFTFSIDGRPKRPFSFIYLSSICETYTYMHYLATRFPPPLPPFFFSLSLFSFFYMHTLLLTPNLLECGGWRM